MKVLKAIFRWCGRHKIWTYFIVTLGGNFLITICLIFSVSSSFVMSEAYLDYSNAVTGLSVNLAYLTMILFPPYLLFIWLYGKAKTWHKEKHGNGEE